MKSISPMRELRPPMFEAVEGTGKLHPDHSAAIRNADWFPGITTYGHYRMLVLAASQPDTPTVTPTGPTGEHPFSSGFSDADQEIINRTAKLCGFEARKLSDNKSSEPDGVHKNSPVNHNSGKHR